MAAISVSVAGGGNVVAFLDMLAWSEGTSTIKASDDGYNVIVGGGLFNSYADHPRQLVFLPRLNIRSTAAGRYQLLSKYWDAYRQSLGLTGGFTPENQDRVALQQIKERRALDDIKAGRVREAIAKCSNIWASLPGAGYGQREHRLEDLVQQYRAAGGVVA
ncbi:glycoside hydrolase family 104 protein [Pseudomonas nitroreducens]|uniref:glycoside hydrolase family 24 protein n=1 Tax=Pseudomonas nitroreducens TaxID=46680 RepID=UPI0024497AA7|nr:glycoside hydrolase family 104 protein [Pseudomonas nitroreducens]MDG9855603.1 glycoside hydrolase family 104 protein [Pseudomonas nitroreducens]